MSGKLRNRLVLVASGLAVAGVAVVVLLAASSHAGAYGAVGAPSRWFPTSAFQATTAFSDVTFEWTSASSVPSSLVVGGTPHSMMSKNAMESLLIAREPEGTRVLAASLAKVASVPAAPGSDSAAVYWVIALDPAGGVPMSSGGGLSVGPSSGALPSASAPSTPTPNVFLLFVNPYTGKTAMTLEEYDPAVPPLPVIR